MMPYEKQLAVIRYILKIWTIILIFVRRCVIAKSFYWYFKLLWYSFPQYFITVTTLIINTWKLVSNIMCLLSHIYWYWWKDTSKLLNRVALELYSSNITQFWIIIYLQLIYQISFIAFLMLFSNWHWLSRTMETKGNTGMCWLKNC